MDARNNRYLQNTGKPYRKNKGEFQKINAGFSGKLSGIQDKRSHSGDERYKV